MTIEIEFHSYNAEESEIATRLEVVHSQEDENRLQERYINAGRNVLDPSFFCEDGATSLSSPRDLLRKVKRYAEDTAVVLTGMTHYLNMWGDEFCRGFFSEMKGLLEKQKVDLVVILQSSAYNPDYIKQPKYAEGRSLILLKAVSPTVSCKRTVTIADSSKVPKGCNVKNLKGLVSKVCGREFDSSRIYSVEGLRIAGSDLSREVEILRDDREILLKAWGYGREISDEAASELISRCVDSGAENADKFLKDSFGEENLENSNVLKRLRLLEDDVLFDAYLDCVKAKFNHSSYVYKALDTYKPGNPVEHHFVVDAAKAMLSDPDRRRLASERRVVIRDLEARDPLVAEFVRDTRDSQEALCWLNCDTVNEHAELISRVSNRDLEGGIPEEINALYPDLNDYLAVGFDYGIPYLNDYFREYRINKLRNQVPREFLDKVFGAEVPSEVKNRSALVNGYMGEEGVALLVVDGLGAEYLPFLSKKLWKRKLGAEISVARSELPSSTAFNSIEWGGSEIKDLKGLDNIAHNGKFMHEQTEWYENIEADLRYLSKDVIDRISENINNYEKIIVTADHGLTRLAIRAYEQELVSTLDDPDDPDDWRYAKADINKKAPPQVVAVPPRGKNDAYWVMRTYDRFKKSGRKVYETHGGASLEEQLVPFIVVTKEQGRGTMDLENSGVKPQLKESDAFDDLF